jgi:hypothetical protein
MKYGSIILPLVLLGCDDPDDPTEHVYDDRKGPPPGHGPGHDGDTSGGETSTGAPPSENGVPTPTAPCPTIASGVVTFCPAELDTCRDARVVNAAGARCSSGIRPRRRCRRWSRTRAG